MTEPVDLDAVLNDAARVMYTGTRTLMESLAAHCRNLVGEVGRLRAEQAERETRLHVKALVARCEALAAENAALRARVAELGSPPIPWREVSEPGAALKVYTAPVPEPHRSRIAEALDQPDIGGES